MIRTDIAGRALPWARLILETGTVPEALNLGAGQRLSALLVALAALAAALVPVRPELWTLSLASLLGVLALNRRLYALLLRRGGLALAVASVPLHLLYFLYSGASYLYAWAEWRLRRAATALRKLARTVRA
jgi:hypothetical protein